MENFEFCNPTRIIFGRGILDGAGREVKGLGTSCLLVTGMGSVKKTGVYDRLRNNLASSGLDVSDLPGVRSTPVLSKVREGIETARDRGIQVIVALGGGSVMDTAKAVAAGALLERDIWDVFEGRAVIEKALPVVCIPTLAASGSEMNGFMVITNEETGFKLAAGSPHVYPRISFLAPELTFTVPADYTAYGGVDAVCHLMEPYFNGPASFTPVQDELAEGLMRTLMKCTESCIASPQDYNQRAAFMWAATLALNGLTRAGVGDHPFPVHLIEHAISAIYGVAHGAGLAALLPGWMRWKASSAGPEKICQFGRRCLGIREDGDLSSCPEETADSFSRWLRAVGCPASLEDLGGPEKDHGKIAENASHQAAIWGIEGMYGRDVIAEVLSFCQ
jgi:alcohol dehydrogenase YqhD (iron-dependent ADH family)